MLIFSVCDARVRRNTWPAAEEIEIEEGQGQQQVQLIFMNRKRRIDALLPEQLLLPIRPAAWCLIYRNV